MEEFQEGGLVFFVVDALLAADGRVAFPGDEVPMAFFRFQRVPHGQVRGREAHPHMGQGRGRLPQGLAQRFDARALFGRGLQEGPDGGVTPAQLVFGQVQGVLVRVRVVAHDEDGRIAAVGPDEVQPVADPVVLHIVAHVENQHVHAALGEEEGMGGVHELLAAEIPDAAGEVAPQGEGVGLHGEGAGFVFPEGALFEPAHQRGLAHARLAHEEHPHLPPGPALFPHRAVEAQDGLGVAAEGSKT